METGFKLYPNNAENSKSWRQQTSQWRDLKTNDSYHQANNITSINKRKDSNGTPIDLFPPLVGYRSHYDEEERTAVDWQNIEINNIEELLNTTFDVRFFRVIIDKEIVLDSFQSNALLHVPYDVYQTLKTCPETYTKYLLLEESSELHWRSKQLVGIAKVTEMSPLFVKNRIQVEYLCLSKTEIDIHCCEENTLTGLAPIFNSYIELLKKKSLEPLLPNVQPWGSAKVLSRSNSYEQSPVPSRRTALSRKSSREEPTPAVTTLTPSEDMMKRAVENINKTIASKWQVSTQEHVLPLPRRKSVQETISNHVKSIVQEPNGSHTRSIQREVNKTEGKPALNKAVGNEESNSGNAKPKQPAEVIDLTVDWSELVEEDTSKNLVPPLQGLLNPDKSLNTNTWHAIEYENLIELKDFANKRFFMCDVELKTVYNSFGNGGLLLITQSLYDEIPDLQPNPTCVILRSKDSGRFKHVIGIAKVGYKMKNSLEVQVTYVCLSRAQYVLHPWCEDLFADGQEISCEEDMQILLAEYKMSARHKKVTPVFDYVYPWSGNPPVMNPQPTGKRSMEESSSNTKNNRTVANNPNISRHINNSMDNSCEKHSSMDFPSLSNNGELHSKVQNGSSPIKPDDGCSPQKFNGEGHLDRHEPTRSNPFLFENHSPDRMPGNGPSRPNGFSNGHSPTKTGRFSYVNSYGKIPDVTQDKETEVDVQPTIKNSGAVQSTANATHNGGTGFSVGNRVIRNTLGFGNSINTNGSLSCGNVKDVDNTNREDKQLEEPKGRFMLPTHTHENKIAGKIIETDKQGSLHINGSVDYSPQKQPLQIHSVSKTPEIQTLQIHSVSKAPDKNKFPPLRGLFVGSGSSKTLTKQSWEDIERSNLAYIAESGNNEFYLCNTDMNAIRKSFKEHQLEISCRNMENIASFGRVRKLLILRTQLTGMNKMSVVGMAIVNTSASIEKEVNTNKYSVKVSYLCLSIPTFPGCVFPPALNDGVEVFTHISSSFIQQYMLSLRQKMIKPLFPHVYPWSPVLPSQNVTVYPSQPQKAVAAPPAPIVAINSKIDRKQDSYDDDIFSQIRKDTEFRTISFQQIDSELKQQGGETALHLQPVSMSPSKSHILKETVESRMKQYSDDLSRMISGGSCRSTKPNTGLFNVPDRSRSTAGVKKSVNGKVCRGRGRGMVLRQHASTATPGVNA